MLFDQVPDPAGKTFEAAEGINGDGAHRGVPVNDRGMLAEAEVDDLPAGVGGSVQEGKNESAVVVQIGDPPDNVVADSQAIQHLIQTGQPGGHPVCGLVRLLAGHGSIRSRPWRSWPWPHG